MTYKHILHSFPNINEQPAILEPIIPGTSAQIYTKY